jgi:SAM-dependent methyltransferase
MVSSILNSNICPVCSGHSSNWIHKQDRTLSKCSGCGFLWVPEGLAVNEEGISIYEQEKPAFIVDGNESYYLDETNSLSIQDKLRWVNNIAKNSHSLLDVGSNFGHFLNAAEPLYNTTGIELSPYAVDWSIKNFNVNNHVGSIYDIPNTLKGPYDIVTCWDVIEHLPDPKSAFKQLAHLTKNGGYVFLSTPNSDSLIARLMRRHWHYIDLVQHLALFNQTNLSKLYQPCGFKLISFRSFGHHYRIRYICDRLEFLYKNSSLSIPVNCLNKILRPFSNRHIFIHLGDVCGLALQKITG